MKHYSVVIIGAGPAGLTAAYELSKQQTQSLVLEQSHQVGGISRTETYKNYRIDIGGHRFYTKVKVVNRLWQEMLGSQFIRVPRLSRIYYRKQFFKYPLEIFSTLLNLGLIESIRILLSYLKVKLFPIRKEETLEQWVTNRFGKRLFYNFFKTYTEKVWGIPCHQIQADWAAQRIKGLSLKKAVLNALLGSNDTKTLIKEFYYPTLGPGMMWESFQQVLEKQGSEIWLYSNVVKLRREGYCIKSVIVQRESKTIELAIEQCISSMPVTALISRLDPPAPPDVLQAANSLSYRALIIVAIIINCPQVFPDNWIYVHSPEVKVGRIQNFKNWSSAMIPDPGKNCLGLEYFCSEGDDIWNLPDQELLDLAVRELRILNLVEPDNVEDGTVIRQSKAYPVYDSEYRQHLEVIQNYLAYFENLQTIGRNGMHRYNNQDHSMLTGILAARNLLGEHHDLWNVNLERSYYEDFCTKSSNS